MHARIKFDVDGPTRDTFTLGSSNESIKQTEGIDFGLEVVVEKRLERRHLRIHHHDIRCNARTAQGCALVGYGHSQIVHTVILQRLGNLDGSCAIGISLNHADEFRFRLHERAIVVEVFHHSGEVYLERRLVNLLHKQFRDLVETEGSGTLQEDGLVLLSSVNEGQWQRIYMDISPVTEEEAVGISKGEVLCSCRIKETDIVCNAEPKMPVGVELSGKDEIQKAVLENAYDKETQTITLECYMDTTRIEKATADLLTESIPIQIDMFIFEEQGVKEHRVFGPAFYSPAEGQKRFFEYLIAFFFFKKHSH